MELTMRRRRVLAREVVVRHRKSDKAGKKRILDEFMASIGCHRRYAISLFIQEGKKHWLRVGGITIKAEIRDVAAGWTDHYPLKNKTHKWIREAQEDAGSRFVFPPSTLSATTVAASSSTTPGRTKKQQYVRKTTGYSRYSGDAATLVIRTLYAPWTS
jgi:hypothetical protein